jgi:osmoprotectant transport system ATP-binding protein
MFTLRSIEKAYAGRPVLGPLSFELPTGKTTVLIGPSGCGKSTLLRVLIGLVKSDVGEVTFAGQPVSDATARAVRHRVGYVIQDSGLFPHLTARQNVTLMARYLGWDSKRLADRIAELAALTRFPLDGLDRYPQQLSGGQKQRVALMRALMLDPDALLLDEPLGALDPLIRADLQAELRDIFRLLKKTVVLVTHDLAEAAFFADRIVLLKDGKIAQEGTAGDLWHRPTDAFVTRFVQAQRGPEVPA